MNNDHAFDIFEIRALNEAAFRNGKRTVCIGSISELLDECSSEQIDTQLQQLKSQLEAQDLILERTGIDRDELCVTQQLRRRQVDPAWMSRAIHAVSMITTIALEMVVPVVAGMWLDQRLGTQFLGLVGMFVGVPLGIWHLTKLSEHSETVDV